MRTKPFSVARRQTETAVRSRLQAVAQPAPAPEPPPVEEHAAAPHEVGAHFARSLKELAAGIGAAWRWFRARPTAQQKGKRLRVVETVSLGEKRFAAVIHIDGSQFLIGGGADGVSLLATLDGGAPPAFSEVLRQQGEQEHLR